MSTVRSILIAILACVAFGCQTTPPTSGGAASLQVHVEAEPKSGLKLPGMRPYDTPAAEKDATGAFERVNYGTLEDIVVWVEPVDPANKPVPPAAEFLPYDVTAAGSADAPLHVASVGQPLAFRNATSKPLTIYSVSDGNEFDLGAIPPGKSGSFTVKSPGLIEVLAEGAKDPVLRVYAAPTGWVKLAHSHSRLNFDLPPGEYTIHSWHPRLPGIESRVAVIAGQTTRANVKVGVNELPKVRAK